MRKIDRRWPKSNQFWRWSGYINMSNFRPLQMATIKTRVMNYSYLWCYHKHFKARSHLSGKATRVFVCMDFPARRKSSAGKLIFCKFCVYFPSGILSTCVSVASVLRGMRATPGDGVWKLPVRYGQHTCTARYGRVNSVLNVIELRARCERTWTYENESFYRYWEAIYQYWEIKIISKYCKNLYGFTDVENYLPIMEITFPCR